MVAFCDALFALRQGTLGRKKFQAQQVNSSRKALLGLGPEMEPNPPKRGDRTGRVESASTPQEERTGESAEEENGK